MKTILNQKNDILEQIFSSLKAHFSEKQQSTLQTFIADIYQDVALADLTQMSQVDLSGLTVSLWREMQEWKGDKPKVKVFNPDVEQDEWQSSHSILTIVCRHSPFVIDTLKLVLNEAGINLHHLFHCELKAKRTKTGKLSNLSGKQVNELVVYFEIDQTSLAQERALIETKIQQALENVSLVVSDYAPLKAALLEGVKESHSCKNNKAFSDIEEHLTFLNWIMSDHFTFIGCDKFSIENGKVKTVENSQLGLLKRRDFMCDMVQYESFETLNKPGLLHFSKASQRPMVHRIAYPDVIYLKRFNEAGDLIEGRRFIGLYTASVYSGTATAIPVVRKKVENILEKSGYNKRSHYYKEVAQILHTYPTEDLLLVNETSLLQTALEVLHAQERKEIRLFLRTESNQQFVIATLYVPRDIYNTEVRQDFETLISRTLNVSDIDFQTYLSESNLSRLRLVIRLKEPLIGGLETKAIEDRIKQIIKPWSEGLQESLIENFGEEKGSKLVKKYSESFPSNYQSLFNSRVATTDIESIESLFKNKSRSMALRFYRSLDPNSSVLKLKLFHQDGSLMLSELLPILEKMNLKVAEEYPYRIVAKGADPVWIYDFTLAYEECEHFNPDDYRDLFSDAFLAVWYGRAENDNFNKLVL
ncbi:MAG TPA: NAD-glutamate dehydrogenase, partial [Psychromonas hadalis]|nr:NAD-glutamate dehydrogenase [Psychromonas hadalis]